jgi:hypothetical protein
MVTLPLLFQSGRQLPTAVHYQSKSARVLRRGGNQWLVEGDVREISDVWGLPYGSTFEVLRFERGNAVSWNR